MAETKEKLAETGTGVESASSVRGKEQSELVDVIKSREAEIPKEVEGWLEKVERGGENDDATALTPGHPTAAVTPTTPTITTVPFSRNQFIAGFKKKFNDAGRWLSAFWLRIIKIKQGRVKFEE